MFDYAFYGWQAYMLGSQPNLIGHVPNGTEGYTDTRPYEFYHPTPISTTLGAYRRFVGQYCPYPHRQIPLVQGENGPEIPQGFGAEYVFELKVNLKSRLARVLWETGPKIEVTFHKGEPGKSISGRFRWVVESFEYRKNRKRLGLIGTEPLLVLNPLCALQGGRLTGQAYEQDDTQSEALREEMMSVCQRALNATLPSGQDDQTRPLIPPDVA
jgi:hypothetical protein